MTGTSTRKVAKLGEGLCGHAFSHTTISNMVAKLDDALQAFASRGLEDTKFPYVMLDARYEKVREAGAVRARAVQIAVGIDTAGKRHLLAVELAQHESEPVWTAFLSGLKERGLQDVEYVASDSHDGLKRAIAKVLPTALWQRCAVHFLRNAADHASHQTDPACLDELKRLWSCSDLVEARKELGAWIQRWGEETDCVKPVGSVGDCYDNAMAESFFATLKSECTSNRPFETLAVAEREIGLYINEYYNNERLHSSIGYRTPNDVEQSFKSEEANL